MKFLIVINIIIGGLLFIYFNIKITCKLNFTIFFLYVYLDVIFFKRTFTFIKKVEYSIVVKEILDKNNNIETFSKYKHYLKYFKYLKYPLKIFIIINFYMYEECFQNRSSIAIEFNIVNKLLKKSLLNG